MPTLSTKYSFLDSYVVVGIWSHLKRINICSLSYNWNGFIFPLLYFLVFIFVYISQHPLHPSNICLCKETPWDTSITFSLTVRPIYIYIYISRKDSLYSIWVHSSCMNVFPENQWHCSVLIWLSHNCSNGASELQGIDILAGVEAIISHLVVKNFNIPCAHAPALLSAPLSASLCPKSASEEVSRIFLGVKKHIDLLHVFAVLLCVREGNHGIFHIYSFVVSLGFWNSETTFGA